MNRTTLTDGKRRKVYDGFMFSFEIDILWLRLNELAPYVDKFILVEAGETFSGNKKDLVWSKIKGHPSFIPFEDKVIYIPLRGFPLGMTDPWKREAYQRMAIGRGLPADADDGDILLISDCDEIPNLREEQTRDRLQHMATSEWLRFVQQLYNYTPHWLHVKPWHGSAALSVYTAKLQPPSIQHTRVTQGWSKLIDPGGWSFTYFGGVDDIQAKVASYSHTEVNQPEYTSEEHIKESIEKGLPLVRGDGNEYRYVRYPVGLPEIIYQHPDVFGLKI